MLSIAISSAYRNFTIDAEGQSFSEEPFPGNQMLFSILLNLPEAQDRAPSPFSFPSVVQDSNLFCICSGARGVVSLSIAEPNAEHFSLSGGSIESITDSEDVIERNAT